MSTFVAKNKSHKVLAMASGKAERLYKLEGEPKGVSIEQFLDEPSGKPSAASSRVYPIRCLTSGSGIVRNGLFPIPSTRATALCVL